MKYLEKGEDQYGSWIIDENGDKIYDVNHPKLYHRLNQDREKTKSVVLADKKSEEN